MQKKVLFALGLLSLSTWLLGCDNTPECKSGEIRFIGRPAQRLFDFDTTCRADCFSAPSGSSCQRECTEHSVPTSKGLLQGYNANDTFGDRTLSLVDTETLGTNGALVLSFGYEDEAGELAPTAGGFLNSGEEIYLSDRVLGTARFKMHVGVALDANQDGVYDIRDSAEVVGSTLNAYPGRLEISEASAEKIRGNFYLQFDTPTSQPESEMIGCFNLSVGAQAADANQILSHQLGQ
ncbi:MAG: hypothetical protein QGI45_04505 [Myxococcota bacterium]|jgi:hypothetical protein|nr:hypothetical protein [Myxococcota bacterium]